MHFLAAPGLPRRSLLASVQAALQKPLTNVCLRVSGKRLYGVQARPACRVLRYAADAAASATCAAADARQAAPPAGRRHDAFLRYMDGLRRSEQQAEERGVPRPVSTGLAVAARLACFGAGSGAGVSSGSTRGRPALQLPTLHDYFIPC